MKINRVRNPPFLTAAHRSWRSWFYLVGMLCANIFAAPSSQATDTLTDLLEQVDYPALVTLLGDNLPLGENVPIAQVEAGEGAAPNFRYLPNPAFGFFTGINLIDATGCGTTANLSCDPSGHATNVVGNVYYGSVNSQAPGVDTVTIYEANDWLNNVLNRGQPGAPAPDPHDFRVENSSWAGAFPNDADNIDVLERFDYLIDNNNITAVVGIAGGLNVPKLLAHSYNAIAVGVSNGNNGENLSLPFYGGGRSKPDIVGPGDGNILPSTTTAMVSSSATLLHDAAQSLPIAERTPAATSEVMKAVLLAGATKGEFSGASPAWNRTSTNPLDGRFGAGELNILNSYLVQLGGQNAGSSTQPAAPVSIDGWDYGISTDETPLYYNFEVPVGSTATELSIILAWNAEVTDSVPGGNFTGVVSLDDLNLRLYDSSTAFLGTEIDSSVSTVDNVEHIYQTNLSPGTYTLELTNLTSSGSRDFGLAWRMETLLDVVSADFNEDIKTDGADFLTWQSGYGALTGAAHAGGDADGDGDVDQADLVIFSSTLAASSLSTAFTSVPEASTLVLAAIASAILPYLRSCRAG